VWLCVAEAGGKPAPGGMMAMRDLAVCTVHLQWDTIGPKNDFGRKAHVEGFRTLQGRRQNTIRCRAAQYIRKLNGDTRVAPATAEETAVALGIRVVISESEEGSWHRLTPE
jgi:hypothetical protein